MGPPTLCVCQLTSELLIFSLCLHLTFYSEIESLFVPGTTLGTRCHVLTETGDARSTYQEGIKGGHIMGLSRKSREAAKQVQKWRAGKGAQLAVLWMSGPQGYYGIFMKLEG